MDTEYISSSSPRSLQSSMFTGMFAAELLVKKAVRALLLMQYHMSGYGLRLRVSPTMIALIPSDVRSIVHTSRATSWPYCLKIASPLVETALNTRPMIPNGAQLMTQRTTTESALARSAKKAFVPGPAAFRASPTTTAQNRMAM